MDIKAIQALSQQDMDAVNKLILARLQSDVALVNQVGFYIVNGGGKRIRPLIATLCARALGYQGQQHINIAAIVEFIHTSTLLHDDVVDESDMRRGRDTANATFGNAASVLVGDFLYSRSFQMMAELKNSKIIDILANATNVIAEGEVLQLMNCNDADTDEARYMDVIYYKTAKLFEAATQIAAVIAEQPAEIEQAMIAYGVHLGAAFQIIDDVMDYTADAQEMGKNVGDDLAEGKPTLPLIHVIANGDAEEVAMIRAAIETMNGMEHLDQILAILVRNGSLQYCLDKAQQEAELAVQALSVLADSEYKQALISLAYIAANRSN